MNKATIYTRVDEDISDLIGEIAEGEEVSKSKIIQRLIESGLKVKQSEESSEGVIHHKEGILKQVPDQLDSVREDLEELEEEVDHIRRSKPSKDDILNSKDVRNAIAYNLKHIFLDDCDGELCNAIRDSVRLRGEEQTGKEEESEKLMRVLWKEYGHGEEEKDFEEFLETVERKYGEN